MFERHLQSMAQGGTWGDHLEISAFAEAYGCDVKIYQRDFAYIVAPPPVVTSEEGVAGEVVETEKHASQDVVETAVQQPVERKQEEVPASDEEPELHRQTKEHERTTEGPEQIETGSSIAQQPGTCGLESRDVKREECDFAPSGVSPVVTEAEPSHQQQPSTLVQEEAGPSEHQTEEPKARVGQAQPPASQRPTAHIAYHSWEHYSSIRNLAGPHLGPPNVTARVLTLAEEQEQRKQLAQTPYTVLPWQIDVVSKSLPFLTDKTSITQALITAKGDINSAVCALLDRDDHVERDDGTTTSVGSSSRASWQESSSVERDPDSDDEENEEPGFSGGPKKKRQDRRKSRGGLFSASSGIARSSSSSGIGKLRVRRSADARHALSQLASFSDASASQESLLSTTTAAAAAAAGGWDSETSSSFLDGPAHGSAGSSTHPSSVDESPADCIAVAPNKPHDPTAALSQTTVFSAGGAAPGVTSQTNAGSSTPGGSMKTGNKPPVRLKLLGPRPPAAAPFSSSDSSSVTFTAGGNAASSSSSRMTARDRKDIKKLAQKAARKERHLQESQQHQQQQQQQVTSSVALVPARENDGGGSRPTAETPPVVVDTLRTLYI